MAVFKGNGNIFTHSKEHLKPLKVYVHQGQAEPIKDISEIRFQIFEKSRCHRIVRKHELLDTAFSSAGSCSGSP